MTDVDISVVTSLMEAGGGFLDEDGWKFYGDDPDEASFRLNFQFDGAFINGKVIYEVFNDAGIIRNGTFARGSIVNNDGTPPAKEDDAMGTIVYGTFESESIVNNNAHIKGGVFKNGSIVNNRGFIYGGSFENESIINNTIGSIYGGSFESGSIVNNSGSIEGGSFESGSIINHNGSIYGGSFESGSIINHNGSIYGGSFEGIIKLYSGYIYESTELGRISKLANLTIPSGVKMTHLKASTIAITDEIVVEKDAQLWLDKIPDFTKFFGDGLIIVNNKGYYTDGSFADQVPNFDPNINPFPLPDIDPTPKPEPKPEPEPKPDPTPQPQNTVDISGGSQNAEINANNNHKMITGQNANVTVNLISTDGAGANVDINNATFGILNATHSADTINLNSSHVGVINSGFGFDTLLLDASSKIDFAFGFNAVNIKGVSSAYTGFGAIEAGQIAFLNSPLTMMSINLFGYETGSYFIGVDGYNTQLYSVNESKGLDLIANLNGAYLIDTNGALVSFTNMPLI